jgi:hypothetical protein
MTTTTARTRLTPAQRAGEREEGGEGTMGEDAEEPLMKKKPSKRAKVIKLAPRRRAAEDLVKFIDAHGRKLGAFRAYQVRPPSPA